MASASAPPSRCGCRAASRSTTSTVLAAGIARLVRRQKLERVVLTSSKAEVVRWTGAAWAYFPATRTLVVNAAPGAKPQVRLTLDDDETDEQFMRKLPPPPPPPGPQPTSSVMHTFLLYTSTLPTICSV